MPEDGTNQNTNQQGGDGGGTNSQNQQAAGWKTELPESQRGHEAFASYTTKSDFYKGHMELWGKHREATQKLIDLEGRMVNAVIKPGDNATPEEIAAYYVALGRPETLEQYTFEPHGLPDGVMDPTIEAWFRKAAFDTGLNNVQAGTLYKQYMDMLGQKYTETMAARERVREEALTKLYAEWGDKRAENIETIKRALKQFGDSELGKYFDETGKGNDPVLINFLLKVGKAMSEDTFVKGSQSQGMQRKIDPGTGMPVFDYPSMQENNSGG